MKEVLPMLKEFADHHPDPNVQEMATDIRIAIATRGMILPDLLKPEPGKDKGKGLNSKKESIKVKSEGDQRSEGLGITSCDQGASNAGAKKSGQLIEVLSSTYTDDKPRSQVAQQEGKFNENENEAPNQPSAEGHTEFQQALRELCDPLIPVRGHALITIRRLIEKKDPETLSKEQVLLKVFRENLDHGDSYLYLASVQGLSALADRLHAQVVPTLAQEYAAFPRGQQQKGQEEKMKKSPELRMKIGEVLVKTSRSLGKEETTSQISLHSIMFVCWFV